MMIVGRAFAGDGSIDETEFSQVCKSYGVEESESREAFKKLQVVSFLSLSIFD